MKRIGVDVAICTVVVAVAAMVCVAGDAESNYKPKEGYVPDAETEIAIAVAVWNPIYGKEHIAKEKPYTAILSKGIWTVMGSLPKGVRGGTAIAEISKDDGRILRVIHEK